MNPSCSVFAEDDGFVITFRNRRKAVRVGAEVFERLIKPYESLMSRQMLSYTGTVVQKEVQGGSSVTAGTLLFTIADLSDLVVEVEVEENKLWAWKPGTEMVITGDAFGGRRVNGVIEKVLPVASTEIIAANKAKYRAYIVPANPDDLLLPGLTVSLRFAEIPTRMGFKVPVGAILDDTGKAKSVFVVEEGRAKKKRVHVGMGDGSRVEVISGLSPGDEVIIEGCEKLQDGQVVRSVKN